MSFTEETLNCIGHILRAEPHEIGHGWWGEGTYGRAVAPFECILIGLYSREGGHGALTDGLARIVTVGHVFDRWYVEFASLPRAGMGSLNDPASTFGSMVFIAKTVERDLIDHRSLYIPGTAAVLNWVARGCARFTCTDCAKGRQR
jgi:hypothetical protein